MALVEDFLLDTESDLAFTNGDLHLGPSDTQHVFDHVEGYLAWFKEQPMLGVGIGRYLNSVGQQTAIARQIRANLIADGFSVNAVNQAEDGTWTINADRNA